MSGGRATELLCAELELGLDPVLAADRAVKEICWALTCGAHGRVELVVLPITEGIGDSATPVRIFGRFSGCLYAMEAPTIFGGGRGPGTSTKSSLLPMPKSPPRLWASFGR